MKRALYYLTGWFAVVALWRVIRYVITAPWRGCRSILRFWLACARFGYRLGGGYG